MSEKRPRTPESMTSGFTSKRQQRHLLERVLIGADIGVIALPVLAFGISSLVLGRPAVSMYRAYAQDGTVALQIVAGVIFGGIVGSIMPKN